MSETLHTCPGCKTTGFTTKGLKAHKCKGPKTEAITAEVTDEQPLDPAWDQARQQLAALKATGRVYLYQQALFGWHLANLKKEHQANGGGRGGDRKSIRQVGGLISWPKKVQQETGLSDRTADRFIALHDATKAKLKRLIASDKKKKADGPALSLALLETANPLALPLEQREKVQEIVSSLCDGLTQGSLMAELGVVPKAHNLTTPPEKEKGGEGDQLTPEQMAFHFFDGPASAIVKARTAADYHTLLNSLPVVADEEGKVSLSFLRAEAAALLADIEQAMAAHAKPAKASKA
jgi:hypothetical protein